jgi:DMSO/TMAO reductase YedYZ molybdopterin-dependent catalytic subunit
MSAFLRDGAARTGFLAGALAGVAITWLGYGAYRLWAIPFLPAAFSDLLFAIVPGPLQAQAIALLGGVAKLLAFYLFTLAQIVAFGWVGLRLTRVLSNTTPVSPPKRLFESWLKVAIIVFGLLLLLSFTGASSGWSWWALVAGTAGTATLYIAFLEFSHRLLNPAASIVPPEPETERSRYTRRDLLAALASTTGAALLWPLLARELAGPIPSLNVSVPLQPPSINLILPGRFDDIPGLPPRVTPNEQFYYVSKNLLPHQARDWGPLRLEGLVERPLALSFQELDALTATEAYVTLACVDYEPNNILTNDLISTALWRGTSLAALLADARLRPEATTLELYATDGYSTAIPIQLALSTGTILAYEMNGQPLDARHGFPVRLIVPGLYGYKNIKHLNRIVASARAYYGYWERRGWAQQAPYKMLSRITTPAVNSRLQQAQPVWIAGIAFAGVNGISKVEVSTDNGTRWQPAELEEPLSPYSWTRWAYQWTPSQKRAFALQVRATDGSGRLQPGVDAQAFPDGATGYNIVAIQVAS